MADLVRQLFENYPTLSTVLSGILAAHGLALFIVNLTDTPVDNKIARRVYKVVEFVAGVTNRAKTTQGEVKESIDEREYSMRKRLGIEE